MPQAPPLIEIEGLKTYFHTDGEVVRAVDDLNISIREGQTLGLVGESGSGKSVTSLTIMRLLPDVSAKIEAGSISFLGRDLVRLPKSEMCDIRGSEISMIFQEPGTSLNPVYRVGAQVGERGMTALLRVGLAEIDGAEVIVVAISEPADADPGDAGVVLGAAVAVVAGGSVPRGVLTARDRIAAVGGTRIAVLAIERDVAQNQLPLPDGNAVNICFHATPD